jgi:predicted  nucleic acid-binding Zn-ribbon protein
MASLPASPPEPEPELPELDLPFDDSSHLDDEQGDTTVGDMSLPLDQQRHLMNLESSFRIEGDTTMGAIGRGQQRSIGPALPVHLEEESEPEEAEPEPKKSTVPASRERSDSLAGIISEEISSPTEEEIAALEKLTSSPTAAAHVRNISRAATASENLNEMFRSQSQGSSARDSPRPSEIGVALDRLPSAQGYARDSRSRSRPNLKRSTSNLTNTERKSSLNRKSSSNSTLTERISTSTLTERKSSTNINQANPAEKSTSDSNPTDPAAAQKRKPKFLRSREAPQRSSVSSIVSMDDDSTTQGQPLSRQTSLGSIASGITALAGGSSVYGERNVSNTMADHGNLERLDEEEQGNASDEDDRPVTPKEKAIPLPTPTETAIAAQVKNVRVPPTVTREFSRHFGVPASPSKKAVAATGTPATAARGREMTLKEQTASIDRLQKENFDLKIKVYYLNEKLEKQSEEGVKEALQENVEMKVKLAEGMRERKLLKKRIKELEKQVEDLGGEKEREEEASAAAESEEIWELRETVERYKLEIEEYRRRDAERTERMREFRRQTNGHNQVTEEQLVCADRSVHPAVLTILQEQLKDLLASETARREAQEAETHRLHEEIYRMRTQELQPPSMSRANSRSDRDYPPSRNGENSITAQLRRENEELRREVSAQTSMLTSRNREKERLYAEIEDLKITMRNGGSAPAFESASRAPSVFSDRLLDRSVSRSGGVASQASQAVTESEREDFENTNDALRDRISELRIKNQDLLQQNQELQQQLEEVLIELEQRRDELDEHVEELDIVHQEMEELQADRDEALRQRDEIEHDFELLKEEAEEELRRLEEEAEVRVSTIEQLEDELRLKTEDFNALQQELRNVSDSVVRFEDQQDLHQGEIRTYEERIQELERTIRENEQEMNVLENSLREANEKLERLTVQGESSKGEIAFLREEQDGDKIRIGELQSKIKQLEKALDDERDKVREARQQLDSERSKREQHGDSRQQEWERRLNEKSAELTAAKDEVRRLKAKCHNREDEAKTWRERLEDLEKGLREALGDLGGTRTGLMQSVLNLQSDLDATLEELDQARNELSEKDRSLKERENLLERMALESRKLNNLLEKERNLRSQDRNALEILQNMSTEKNRRISMHQQQTETLEKTAKKGAKNFQLLESQLRDQISERNSLLLQVWTRLSQACGNDWAARNCLVVIAGNVAQQQTEKKVSMEDALTTSSFLGFSRNLLSAVKTIESLIAGFKTKCRGVERDLWKEYQLVENALEQRTRRIERLEGLVRAGVADSSDKLRNELAKLRSENKILKAEIGAKTDDKQTAAAAPPPPPPPPAAAPMKRTDSSRTTASEDAKAVATTSSSATTSEGGEKRWILRLRELEKRLKQEREARLLDRSMANKKILETKGEREEIRRELEREKIRGRSGERSE